MEWTHHFLLFLLFKYSQTREANAALSSGCIANRQLCITFCARVRSSRTSVIKYGRSNGRILCARVAPTLLFGAAILSRNWPFQSLFSLDDFGTLYQLQTTRSYRSDHWWYTVTCWNSSRDPSHAYCRRHIPHVSARQNLIVPVALYRITCYQQQQYHNCRPRGKERFADVPGTVGSKDDFSSPSHYIPHPCSSKSSHITEWRIFQCVHNVMQLSLNFFEKCIHLHKYWRSG
jgi:hypothetical protein